MTSDEMQGLGAPPFDLDAIPEQAVLVHGGGALRLTWRDGVIVSLNAEPLRLACRCAWCTRDRVLERFPSRISAVAMTHLEPIGGYAINIAFDDGHARGIYPWAYIRQLADDAQTSGSAGEAA